METRSVSEGLESHAISEPSLANASGYLAVTLLLTTERRQSVWYLCLEQFEWFLSKRWLDAEPIIEN